MRVLGGRSLCIKMGCLGRSALPSVRRSAKACQQPPAIMDLARSSVAVLLRHDTSILRRLPRLLPIAFPFDGLEGALAKLKAAFRDDGDPMGDRHACGRLGGRRSMFPLNEYWQFAIQLSCCALSGTFALLQIGRFQ